MWKKYAAVTSTVMARKAGLKMSEIERLRTRVRHGRQRRDRRVAEPLERAVDLLERALRLLAREPMHGLGHEEEHERNEHERDRGAELEHVAPVRERAASPTR